HIDAWLAIDPDNRTARHHRGIALFGLGKANDAYKEFGKAYEGATEDQFLPPAITLGRLFEREGDHNKAMEWMRFAQGQGKDDFKRRLALAQWLWEMGQYEDAHPHAFKALELKSDSLDAKIILGTVLRYLKSYDKAEQQLQDATVQSPGNFTASNQL